MKSLLFGFLLLLTPKEFVWDANAGANAIDRKCQDMVGEYFFLKQEEGEPIGSGWNYVKRYGRRLTLQTDGTFLEVNSSYEAFDYADRQGCWSIKGDSLVLEEITYVRRIESITDSANELGKEYLKILSKDELLILGKGFLQNAVLVKQ